MYIHRSFLVLISFLFLNFYSFKNENKELAITSKGDLSKGLVAHYSLDGNGDDTSGNGYHASVLVAKPSADRFGNESRCFEFDGLGSYLEFPDKDEFSISTTGALTISIWLRPDVSDFNEFQGSGFIHWIGKGESKQQEWAFRMYNKDSDRPNRISGYVFNLKGGLGAGSYVEENVSISKWIHLVVSYNSNRDEIKLYKNGVLKDTDTFSGYAIDPQNGTAPLRIGTRDLKSFFKGGLDDLRIYNRALRKSEITELYKVCD